MPQSRGSEPQRRMLKLRSMVGLIVLTCVSWGSLPSRTWVSRWRLGPGCCLVVALGTSFAVFPAGTAARSQSGSAQSYSQRSHRLIEQRAHAAFRVQGSHGYRIAVSGSPRGVVLIASRRHAAAVYLDEGGKADESGIQANFGRLGEISVRF